MDTSIHFIPVLKFEDFFQFVDFRGSSGFEIEKIVVDRYFKNCADEF